MSSSEYDADADTMSTVSAQTSLDLSEDEAAERENFQRSSAQTSFDLGEDEAAERENFQRSQDIETWRRLTKDNTKVIGKIETGVLIAWFWRFFCQLLRTGKGAK